MIIHLAGCRLTARDFRLCMRLLEQQRDHAFREELREKLASSCVAETGEIAPFFVQIGSRIEFSVDAGPPIIRTLVHDHARQGMTGLTLPVATPRGLALLGMRVAQEVTIFEHGRPRKLAVHRIFHHPPAIVGDEPARENTSILRFDPAAAKPRRLQAATASGEHPQSERAKETR